MNFAIGSTGEHFIGLRQLRNGSWKNLSLAGEPFRYFRPLGKDGECDLVADAVETLPLPSLYGLLPVLVAHTPISSWETGWPAIVLTRALRVHFAALLDGRRTGEHLCIPDRTRLREPTRREWGVCHDRIKDSPALAAKIDNALALAMHKGRLTQSLRRLQTVHALPLLGDQCMAILQEHQISHHELLQHDPHTDRAH